MHRSVVSNYSRNFVLGSSNLLGSGTADITICGSLDIQLQICGYTVKERTWPHNRSKEFGARVWRATKDVLKKMPTLPAGHTPARAVNTSHTWSNSAEPEHCHGTILWVSNSTVAIIIANDDMVGMLQSDS